MKRRGLATVTALVAVAMAACTSEGEVAGELRDIREVVTEAEADPAGDEPGSEVEPPAEETGASAEAPEPIEAEPAEAPEPDPDIDITTVPEEITLEYVQAVLDELERILAEALILLMEEGEFSIEIADYVGEIFTFEQRDLRLAELETAADADFANMNPSHLIEPRHREVISILDVSEDCLYVEAWAHEQGIFPAITEPSQSFVVLHAREHARPVEVNPTPWVYAALAIGDETALRQERPCHD